MQRFNLRILEKESNFPNVQVKRLRFFEKMAVKSFAKRLPDEERDAIQCVRILRKKEDIYWSSGVHTPSSVKQIDVRLTEGAKERILKDKINAPSIIITYLYGQWAKIQTIKNLLKDAVAGIILIGAINGIIEVIKGTNARQNVSEAVKIIAILLPIAAVAAAIFYLKEKIPMLLSRKGANIIIDEIKRSAEKQE